MTLLYFGAGLANFRSFDLPPRFPLRTPQHPETRRPEEMIKAHSLRPMEKPSETSITAIKLMEHTTQKSTIGIGVAVAQRGRHHQEELPDRETFLQDILRRGRSGGGEKQ